MTRCKPVFIALSLVACSGSGTDSPSKPGSGSDRTTNSESSDDIAGGSTEDFTGDMEGCTTTSQYELDEVTPLGYSGADVLANAEGRFEVPIRWVSLCQQSGLACTISSFCDGDSPQRPMSALAGTATTVSVEIEARDAPVEVIHRTPAEPSCGEGMRIPVSVRIESADGALAESMDDFLGAGTPDTTQSTLGFRRSVSELQGALANDSALPDDGLFRMVFGFYGTKVWMEIDVEAGGDEESLPVPLLSDMLPPFDTCALDIPRDEVVVQ